MFQIEAIEGGVSGLARATKAIELDRSKKRGGLRVNSSGRSRVIPNMALCIPASQDQVSTFSPSRL
jgi:hypothetical protein